MKKKNTNKSYIEALKELLDEQGITPQELAQIGSKPTETVKPVEKKEERTWFQKGAFEDGYQFGDVSKTILGTMDDTWKDLQAGVLGIVEGTIDAGAYLVGGAGGLFGAKDFQSSMEKFIEKDIIDEETIAKSNWNPLNWNAVGLGSAMYLGDDSEDESVFGDKTDSLVQSGGQLLGQIGLQAVGVPWFVTSGVTSFGSQVEGALNEGASYGEAGLSGLVSAGADILTEKMFGGSGLGEKGLINLEPLTKGISNKVVKALADYGVDVMAEGSEEVVASVISKLGDSLYKEESLSELLMSEEAIDEYIESFIGGAALGGIMNSSNAYKSATSGRDYRTGLNTDERTVVDKEFEKRIAEEEKNGKTLSKKEKDEIYDRVLKDLDKGYISIDTIEEALGGDTYTNYRDANEYDNALINKLGEMQKEFDTLNDMKDIDMTGKQRDRREELRSQIKAITEALDDEGRITNRTQLRSQLGEEVFNKAQNSRLIESYYEVHRRTQKYEADLSKYDAKQQAIIKKAIDSGILNNQRRTHEMVDFVAKLSADKGVSFDFTNNQKLKESGFAIDGKTVNGYVTKDGITLNINATKTLETVAGHEITHVLEGTELYNELQSAVFEYAKTKKEFDSRRKELAETYKNVKDADIDAELTADLIGDYLFTDADFIKNLSVNHRNVFQKIYDEIKYLCKIATAGSKEARELEKVKKLFEENYRLKANTTDKTKLSISENTEAKTQQSLSTEQQEYFKDSVVRDENGDLKVMYHGTSKGGFNSFDTYGSNYGLFGLGSYFTDSKNIAESYTNKGKGQNKQVYETYLNITNPIDMDAQADAEAWKKAVPDAMFPESGTNEQFYRAMEEYLEDEMYSKWEAAEFAMDTLMGMGYDGITHIGGGRVNADGERHQVYIAFHPEQIKNIDNTKPTDSADIRYSISDSEGNKLTKGQQEYFKESKMRDDNGNLAIMYHGSQDAGFHEFEQLFSDDNTSFFFVDNPKVAKSYSGTDETYTAKTFRTAEDFNNFFAEIGADEYEVKEEVHGNYKWFTLYEDGTEVASSETTKALYDEFRDWTGLGTGSANYKVYLNLKNPLVVDAKNGEWDSLAPIKGKNPMTTREYAQYAKEQGYDGVIFKNIVDNGAYASGLDRYNSSTVAIAFDSNQIKSVANENPTEHSDIRYSLSADSQGRELTAEQKEYFKDSKIVDENGNLKVMYHGSPNGEYTVFKDGTYFTENKWYADLYQNPNASSISTKKNANAPKTFEVYLNIKKPFDLNDAEARNIYINDYIKGGNAVGINPYLSDAEYDKINSIDWTEGEDLREFLIDNGYDYDGLVLDEGAVGGYGEDVKYRGKSYVVFSPEQVKNIDNTTPTSDPDIRFSLSKSVEETNDLMALHNLNASELLKALDLGGLPMPSIAVIKANASHDQYGDVSLILPKETIDPQKSKDNKVYGGDAWTPTYPKIEYKPNKKVADNISKKYYELYRKYGNENTRSLYKYVNELEETLNYHGGEASMLEELYNSESVMQTYLLDTGKGKIEPIQKEIRTELSEAEVEMNEFFINELGADVVDNVMNTGNDTPINHRKKYWEEHGEKIKETYKKLLSKEYGFSQEEIDNVISNTKTFDYLRFVRDAHLYRKNGKVTTRYETDSQATNEAIKEAAKYGYKEWIDGLFKGIEEKSGIRNNANYFTNSGNRRSWDALHWENTLENVVRVMKQQNPTGADAIFGGNQLFAVSAKEYGSIAEIKNDSHRLYKMSEDEYEAVKESYSQRMLEIANKIMDKGERNQFIAIDNAMECIVEAVRSSKTKAGISKSLKQYNQLNVTDQDVSDIVSLVNDIANMPTGYFEAKPRRAVGFDEVGVFVIPNNAGAKLKQELLNRGYAIAEYDPNTEGDRQKVVNSFEEYKFSLSPLGKSPNHYGIETVENDVFAPIRKDIEPKKQKIAPLPKDAEPTNLYDIQELEREKEALEQRYFKLEAEKDTIDPNEFNEIIEYLAQRHVELQTRIEQLEAEENQRNSERLSSLTDEDAPIPYKEAPYDGEETRAIPNDPFENRYWENVGNPKVKAYMDENPDAKPFFQYEANVLLEELGNTQKGERWYNSDVAYEQGNEYGWGGTKRFTSSDIASLLDSGMSYANIEKGLGEIIEDKPKKSAAAKRIELYIHDRLMKGYTSFPDNVKINRNQAYIDLLNGQQMNEEYAESFDNYMQSLDKFAPLPEKVYKDEPIAPSNNPLKEVLDERLARVQAPIKQRSEAIKPMPEKLTGEEAQWAKNKMSRVTDTTAKILTEEPKAENKKKQSAISKALNHLVDNATPFETLALKTGNRELDAKFNFMRYSENNAQRMIGEGDEARGIRSLKSIQKDVENSGLTEQLYNYLYHQLNVDRMTLEDRYADTPNKPVMGYSVTADISRKAIAQLEAQYPQLKQYATDIYRFNSNLRKMLVDGGVISKETAKLWQEMYPHYVPIRRVGDEGLNINVPLDTNRTGVNAPIKRATGGNRDILPLFDTMAQRTIQTYKAIAKNRFGVELKNTLGTTIDSQKTNLDEVLNGVDAHEELLQEGKNGRNPTFTVFENGERVTFEITEDMYDALKPTDNLFRGTNKALNWATNAFRNLTTEYNPAFLFTNPIKDAQDVLMNSQHPLKTYKNFPKAIGELRRKNGQYYNEYMKNGGSQNTYFNNQTNTFEKEDGTFKKAVGWAPNKISELNNFFERIPRLAEYIASREAGASIEVAMLDSARVTTNFAAGGDVTKWANRNGATFLNASVQGAAQQVRNIREAKAKGLQGWLGLATKFTIAGLSAELLNHLLWEDDEEYEELSDYVKDNYYVVAKYGDGKFIRIPKGRTVAVIQDAFEQVKNQLTGDDEADWQNFFQLFMNNIAPNNPLENNIFAPIGQAVSNKTWYGEDLVPTRLQDLPRTEQYDESTDMFSRWLSEILPFSPYKINYVLNQYSGGIGDMFLPMMTPEAESGDNSFAGNLLAPLKDKFTTDSTMNNQNVADFYDVKDQLTTNAKASGATDEDILKYKYMNSINSELSKLYAEKREIQNSYMDDAVKYERVKEIQREIDDIAKNSLGTYNRVVIDGEYAKVGNRYYRKNDSGEWTKLTDKQIEQQQEVTEGLKIDPAEYWSNKTEYDFAYENPEKYAVAKSVGGFEAYKQYSSELYDIKADKDSSGKSINGSRKKKVIEYVNSLDIDYGARLIIFKSEYNADDTYNYEIIDYLNSRDDITYEEMNDICRELGFTVHSDGTITW